MIAGILLRLYFYFLNKSLWIDEVYLSASIVNMPLQDLLSAPLQYFQKAPLGFLFIQKLFVTIFSANEMSFRLFPLLCGITSLIMFVPVSKYFLTGKYVWLAVGLFAFAPPIIFHAVEAKQYSTELLAAVIAIWLYINYNKRLSFKSMFQWGIWGCLLIWFSYTVIFILAAIAISISIKLLLKRNWNDIKYYLIPFGLWVLSFALNFLFFTQKHAQSEWTVYWFDYYKNFAPLLPKSLEDLKWFPLNFYHLLDYPLGLLWNFTGVSGGMASIFKMAFLPVVMFFAGVVGYLKRKTDLLFFALTILLVLIASALKLYPLTERFWLFLSPIFILLIARGCALINEKFISNKCYFILPVLLLKGPVLNTASFVIKPSKFILHKTSFQKEAMNYIETHYQPGDVVYVYWNDKAGFNLYKQLYKFSFPVMEGKDHRAESRNYQEYFSLLNNDLDSLKQYKRIWLVYNDYYQTDIGEKVDSPDWYFVKDSKPTDKVLAEFLKRGKLVSEYKSFDVYAYCIELYR